MADYTSEQRALIAKTEESMLYGEEPCSACDSMGVLEEHTCPVCGGNGMIRYLKKQLTFDEAIEFAA